MFLFLMHRIFKNIIARLVFEILTVENAIFDYFSHVWQLSKLSKYNTE